MLQNSLDSASRGRWTMTPSAHCESNQRVFLRKISTMLRNGQVSPQMEIQGNIYCISFAEDKTEGKMPREQEGTEDSCNREQRSCSDMTRDKTQWWCLWAPDFQLLLSTKDLQTNIKSNNLIYDFILVSISFTPFKKKKPHIQCVVIHTMFRLFG